MSIKKVLKDSWNWLKEAWIVVVGILLVVLLVSVPVFQDNLFTSGGNDCLKLKDYVSKLEWKNQNLTVMPIEYSYDGECLSLNSTDKKVKDYDVKINNKKHMTFKKEGKIIFDVKSSVDILQVGLFEETGEWAYKSNDWETEIITIPSGAVLKNSIIYDVSSWIDNTPFGFYTRGVFYPPQDNYNISGCNPLNSSCNANIRTFEVINFTTIKVNFYGDYDPTVVTTNMTIFFPLNETSGTDAINFGNSPELGGTIVATTHFEFVNDSDGVFRLSAKGTSSFPNMFKLNITETGQMDTPTGGDASVCLVIKLDEIDGYSIDPRLISFRDGGDANIYFDDSADKLCAFWLDRSVCSTTTVAKDEIWNMCFTFDNSANTGRIYMNGELETTSTGFDQDFAMTPENFYIGHRDFDRPFNGTIGNTRLWNGLMLSSSDVVSVYNTDLNIINLSEGLVSCWDFDESAVDFVGANNGTVSGATVDTTNFKLGNASYHFDGASDFITITNVDDLVFGSGLFTTSMWVLLNRSTPVSFPVMLGKGDTGGGEWMWRMNTPAAGNLNIFGDGGVLGFGHQDKLNGTEFDHIVVVRLSSTETRVWLNGVESSSFDGSNYGLGSTKDLTFGGADGASNRWWDGNIDTSAIWKGVALNERQILTLYDQGVGISCSDITGGVVPPAEEDTTPPTWNETPFNITIGNSSALSVQFNATDETAFDTYAVDDTENFSMSALGVLANATTLSVFNYTLVLTINDSSNNEKSDTIYVDVFDDTPAIIDVSTGLVACYSFDSDYSDDSGNLGTFNNNDVIINSTSKLGGGSAYFNGSAYLNNVNISGSITDFPFSFTYWNSYTDNSDKYHVSIDKGGLWPFAFKGQGRQMQLGHQSVYSTNTGDGRQVEDWTYITVTFQSDSYAEAKTFSPTFGNKTWNVTTSGKTFTSDYDELLIGVLSEGLLVDFAISHIDEFAIWNITLDDSQILSMYDSGGGTSCADIINLADSCTYTSGQWDIDCTDNCALSSNVDLNSNNIVFSGSGTVTITANLTEVENTTRQNSCVVITKDGGGIIR